MINIAIDGPAGAGKSTIARAVAERLGIIYLDTGAMYRAVAYFVLSSGAAVDDEKAVGEALKDISMDIRYEDGAQQIFVNGENVTPFLREPHMSKAASDVSALPAVRYKMVDLQREFAAKHDVVLDGRDIGTFVLPGANCKFYMTASPEERAARRYRELAEKVDKLERQIKALTKSGFNPAPVKADARQVWGRVVSALNANGFRHAAMAATDAAVEETEDVFRVRIASAASMSLLDDDGVRALIDRTFASLSKKSLVIEQGGALVRDREVPYLTEMFGARLEVK